MTLREELEAIRAASGALTAAGVLAAASNPAHPLHDRFEWNDTEAARRFRLAQAAELIRSVRVERGQKPTGELDDYRVRAFHSVTRDGLTAYEPIEEIVRDDISMAVLLRAAEREWRALFTRYQHLKEFRALVARDVA